MAAKSSDAPPPPTAPLWTEDHAREDADIQASLFISMQQFPSNSDSEDIDDSERAPLLPRPAAADLRARPVRHQRTRHTSNKTELLEQIVALHAQLDASESRNSDLHAELLQAEAGARTAARNSRHARDHLASGDTPVKIPKRALQLVWEMLCVWVFALAWDYTFHNKWCDLIYNCGCTWNWDGGWDNCNVHHKQHGPKCPWCYLGEKHPWAAPFVNTTYYFLFGYTLWRALAERRGRTASCRGEWLLALLVGGPLGWVGISLISSLICKFIWDYPYWFWEW
mmetsp:Transcript_33936/g.73149  ORF Transcript_33936/g.73149 Transcript_33936/m.73149 type:complete len:282 (+) Transcript_33936:1935-2780(+)